MASKRIEKQIHLEKARTRITSMDNYPNIYESIIIGHTTISRITTFSGTIAILSLKDRYDDQFKTIP